MPTPTIRTKEIDEKIISYLAEGKLLREIAKLLDIADNTLFQWRAKDPSFDSDCQRARFNGFDKLADSLLTIPDEYDDVNVARLKCDSIKWYLSKLNPAKYGDRIDFHVTKTIDISAALAEAQSRLNQVIDITPQIVERTTSLEEVVRIETSIPIDSAVNCDPLADLL